jgi:alkylation response protein AidB-like acyl-CoA dehydrogenase
MAWDVLTEEQREIRELVRTLARERVAPRAAAIDESHEFPWDVVELFREHELFGPSSTRSGRFGLPARCSRSSSLLEEVSRSARPAVCCSPCRSSARSA